MSETRHDVIPSFAEAAKEADLPEQVKIEELVGKSLVVESWEPSRAVVPQTGEITDGYMTTCIVEETDERVVFFCGQIALKRALAALKPPFRTTISKVGRAYRFN